MNVNMDTIYYLDVACASKEMAVRYYNVIIVSIFKTKFSAKITTCG